MIFQLPIMWHKLLEDKEERFKVVAIQTDRERIAEMDDEAWDWLMTYLKVKWETCPIQGSWLVKEGGFSMYCKKIITQTISFFFFGFRISIQ